MTRVLVITDSERVRELFEILERSGVLQLRSVANLLQSDREISEFSPEFTFVQSRISGLSGEIMLRHLKKHLPAGARLILLAVDADDAVQARKQGRPYLELSDDEEALAEGITAVLAGEQPLVRKKAPAQPAAAAKGRPAKHEEPKAVRPPEGAESASAAEQGRAEPVPVTPPEIVVPEPAPSSEPVTEEPPPGLLPREVQEARKAQKRPEPPPADEMREAETPRQPQEGEAESARLAEEGQGADSLRQAQEGQEGEPPEQAKEGQEGEPPQQAKEMKKGEGRQGEEVQEARGIEGSVTPPPFEAARGVASFEEIMRRASEKEAALAEAPPEERVTLTEAPPPPPEPSEDIAGVDEAIRGVPFSAEPFAPHGALRPKKKQRWWVIPLVLALLAPLFVLLVSKKEPKPSLQPRQAAPPAVPATPAQVAPAQPAVPGVPPAAKPAPAGVPAPAAKPAPTATPPAVKPAPAPTGPATSAKPPVMPAAKPVPSPAVPAAKPAPTPAVPGPAHRGPAGAPARPSPAPPPKAGLKELPSFLSGVGMDPVYSKAHPGWQRYLGARAEYKLYKEGDFYKAIQVIALGGQTVPDEIFRKVLHEFGGVESYQVQSTENKQHYIVEHCLTTGKVALTIYRKISDRRMKGFVLYYQ